MTATETARQAVMLAGKLSPSMRGTVLTATAGNDWTLVGKGQTLNALVDRNVCASPVPGRTLARLTSLGRAVHDVIWRGAGAVLAEARERDRRPAEWQRVYNAEAEALFPDAFDALGGQSRLLTDDEHHACVVAADRAETAKGTQT